jgi:protein TonB
MTLFSTHYLVPATVALSAHVAVFFGFRENSVGPSNGDSADGPEVSWAPLPLLKVVELEPPEAADSGQVKNEMPGADLPRLPDVLGNPDPVTDFPMKVTTTLPRSKIDVAGIGIHDNVLPPGLGGGGPGELVYASSALDSLPRTRLQGAPEYPRSLKQAGVEGMVEVEFVVDESGRVRDARVVRASAPEFAAPTLAAVAHWRFEPGLRQGVPVNFRMRVPVVFDLKR